MPETTMKLVRTESDVVQTQLNTIERRALNAEDRRQTQGKLDEQQNKLREDLNEIANRVIGGLAVSLAMDQARRAISRRLMRGYEMGFALAGLPDWQATDPQIDAIMRLVDEQLVYFQPFISALEAHTTESRIGLYSQAVGSAFWQGFVALLPSDARIYWQLSLVENCVDCIALHAGNPYNKPGMGANPLPTTPKALMTKCGGNCRCYLESVGTWQVSLLNKPGVEITAIGSLTMDPTAPSARAGAALYLDLAERYVWLLRMDTLLPGKGYDQVALAVMQEIQDMMKRYHHDLRLSMNMTEILEPITTSQALGYRFVAPDKLTDDLVLLMAAIMVGNGDVERGQIRSVNQNPPSATLDDGVTYHLDQAGRCLLFIAP